MLFHHKHVGKLNNNQYITCEHFQAGQSRIFSIGEYCAVPFEGEYHRCEVVKVTGHQLSIKFVDYGNVDTVATSEAKEVCLQCYNNLHLT